jgi:hypothetical protein
MTLTPRFAIAAAGLLALAACATTPVPPTAALQAAQLAIANAEQARAAEYAPAELSLARDELASARTAVQREEMVLALHLAQQSRAGAELASARADAAKSAAANEEMRRSNDAMQQEMQRNPGARQ